MLLDSTEQPHDPIQEFEHFFTVVFEDNHLIAVNKKNGVLVQGDDTGDKPLSELVKEYLKKKYNKPGNVFAGVIHRIDRPVSGLVLLAKTSKALERMNKQFADKKIQKAYLMVSGSKPNPASAKLVHWLTKDAKRNIAKAHTSEVKESKYCELSYSLLTSSDRYFLIEVKPVTGRSHQIRCQMASIGCVIKGDLKYGAPRSNPDGGICLHSHKLSFQHPVTGDNMQLKADPPKGEPWNALLKK
ncbi:RluA family pseudouridine synthase [Cytophaga hutchinsonii]|jgi:23S rRNA pseudouridine1911/1915/1917 synthase|uniref:Ribosomal large subunit pseudouridine synthase D n=1 Tax=Cytophaga hutchinsonii (strain ATCC 33406 / DSM 1761 / CIP 103989 / NBRC 15051 / NCIMB 9469 / D465) TaxID=269798 RepID=A0A6N4SV97_CYTH3|nr:RNA pseudouridine synthase [Cytophaga hutchinsonii]ABG60459.1 ribosomal large subunit pseudouridine synthase D [Cytophaga hutchinsonii ATCC 33406]SFX85508.1 ribosomal large subunit pseudouridine synthase D [Cytophaga hutchinsonii ATCC 33406]